MMRNETDPPAVGAPPRHLGAIPRTPRVELRSRTRTRRVRPEATVAGATASDAPQRRSHSPWSPGNPNQPWIPAWNQRLTPSELKENYKICWSQDALRCARFPWTRDRSSGRQPLRNSNAARLRQDSPPGWTPKRPEKQQPEEPPQIIIASPCSPASEPCNLEEAVELQLRED
ncbi:hypothetical protein QAD02_007596 [Eretmocerus hayati]|uniref:Uncharacterized protein n=1 Tax=Eretmocerus hayati TaxID=131215 RepID=A0ACC2N408_9HYME|nr:hypothetical protein QAD02_007596 [Eretmocerus hayati]